MGFSVKGKRSKEGLGMGFFLVFLPDENEDDQDSSSTAATSSSPSVFKKYNYRSTGYNILSRAQSTISICALLIFLTLLLFTLSTFEPNQSLNTPFTSNSRRHLKQVQNLEAGSSKNVKSRGDKYVFSHALQGMGTLYARGTTAMNDLVVCHVTESVTAKEMKSFLRLFYRSGLASRSDLLFLFEHPFGSFEEVIAEESKSFLKLVGKYEELSRNASSDSVPSSELTQFVKFRKEGEVRAETIWGKKSKGNCTDGGGAESTRASYGSVVSFTVSELDPENSLAGFLDQVPMSLRRWACYPMLLGRVRRNFKHVMLVDIKEVLLLGDPLGRVRHLSPESVLLSTSPTKHGKKNSDKTHPKLVNSAIVMGGARGVRRLSSAMLTEVVRATMQQHKRKSPVVESALMNQLVANEFILKNINVVISTESLPDSSSLGGSSSRLVLSRHPVLLRRNSGNVDIDDVIRQHICSFDFRVYSDC